MRSCVACRKHTRFHALRMRRRHHAGALWVLRRWSSRICVVLRVYPPPVLVACTVSAECRTGSRLVRWAGCDCGSSGSVDGYDRRRALPLHLDGPGHSDPACGHGVTRGSGWSIPNNGIQHRPPGKVSRGCPAFQPTASLLPASYNATPDPSTCVYVPYRHIHTGERALVALRRDAITGVRMPIVPPPNGFLPAPVDGAGESPNLLQWLAGLLCRHPAEPSVDPRAVSTTAPAPPTRQRYSPVDIRQPNFDDDTPDGTQESASGVMLTAKTLSNLKTKLELHKIQDWIVDLKAACGRRDEAAHLLISSPDWRALLTGGHPLMITAN